MRRRLSFRTVLAWGLLSLTGLRGDVREAVVSRVAGQLMCSCPCTHLLNQCGDECGVAPQQVREIEALLGEGKTEAQVSAAFEQKYGVSILAVPKAEGFNLLAWIMPFAALLAGLGLVVVVARRLKPAVSPQAQPRPHKMEEKYRRLLEKELQE